MKPPALGLLLAVCAACRQPTPPPRPAPDAEPRATPAAPTAEAGTATPPTDGRTPAALPAVDGGDAPEERVPQATEAPADAAPDSATAEAPGPADAAGGVPAENRERGERPGPESAEAGARRLLEAILRDDPALAADFVFPAEAFDLVKDLPDPRSYHRRLVRWYEEDVHGEHARNTGLEALELERFQLGRCDWIERDEEGNLLPYWSCRRNKIQARDGNRRLEYEIRVLINWGPNWYVTHLGPVRR